MAIKRVKRNRRLNADEVAKYDNVRAQISLELPDLIKRRKKRMAETLIAKVIKAGDKYVQAISDAAENRAAVELNYGPLIKANALREIEKDEQKASIEYRKTIKRLLKNFSE